VSLKLYNSVQRILDERMGAPRKRYPNEHLLSGIARCGECGCFLIGFWSKSHPKKGKYEYLYRFYHHRPSYHTDHRECLGVAKSADRLEELVVSAIHRLARKRDGGTPQNAGGATAVGHGSDEAACNALRSRLAQTGQDMRRWQDQFDGGLIDEARMQMESVANLRQRAELRTQLAAAQAGATDSTSSQACAGAAGQALRDIGSTWDNLNVAEQRQLLGILIDKLHVWADRAELTVEGMPTIRLPLSHKSPARRRRDAHLR